MAEIPCRFVTDFQSPLDLISAHALAGFTDEIGSCKPLDERQVGIMKDRVGCDRELIVTVFAVQEFAGVRKPRRIRIQATRARRAVQPTKTLKKLTAKIIRGEGSAKVDNGHRETSNG